MFRRLVIFCISFTASVTVICTDGTPPLSFAARAANLPLAYDSVGIRFLKKPIPVASQLIFSLDDQLWTIDLAAYGFDGIDPTTIDRAQLRQEIIDTVKQSERKPRDAYFQGEQIVPHLNGRRVDQRQIAYILDHLISLQNRIVPMPVTETEAKITAKTLERLSEKVLGSYTTIYNPYNRPRARNIGLSSTAIDSVIIPVGGIFSFNDIVGPRTPDRGYKRATVSRRIRRRLRWRNLPDVVDAVQQYRSIRPQNRRTRCPYENRHIRPARTRRDSVVGRA